MIERVAEAIYERCNHWDYDGHLPPYSSLADGAKAQWQDAARAAIDAIFAGSRMTEFRDGIVIANPDFPVHFWNGTSMEEVKPADPHAARIGE